MTIPPVVLLQYSDFTNIISKLVQCNNRFQLQYTISRMLFNSLRQQAMQRIITFIVLHIKPLKLKRVRSVNLYGCEQKTIRQRPCLQ